ncbi:hypothetical protein BJ944DRAFT_165678 [Cunninghamella echinulata]|nr:hypothetical protein BJ944DRAFT_165678 [Cunninghamella echinulata]
MSETLSQQVYREANQALQLLSQVKETMLNLLTQMSAASKASITVEPDLEQLQKYRKEYESLMAQLKSKVSWIQENQVHLKQDEGTTYEKEVDQALLEEQQQVQQASRNITEKLKHILSQSYALQLQTDTLLSASYNQPVQ